MSYLFAIVILVISVIYTKICESKAKKLKLINLEDLFYYKSSAADFIFNFLLIIISSIAIYFAVSWIARIFFALWAVNGILGVIQCFQRLKCPKIKYSDTH